MGVTSCWGHWGPWAGPRWGARGRESPRCWGDRPAQLKNYAGRSGQGRAMRVLVLTSACQVKPGNLGSQEGTVGAQTGILGGFSAAATLGQVPLGAHKEEQPLLTQRLTRAHAPGACQLRPLSSKQALLSAGAAGSEPACVPQNPLPRALTPRPFDRCSH